MGVLDDREAMALLGQIRDEIVAMRVELRANRREEPSGLQAGTSGKQRSGKQRGVGTRDHVLSEPLRQAIEHLRASRADLLDLVDEEQAAERELRLGRELDALRARVDAIERRLPPESR